MTKSEAQGIALQALNWLVTQPDEVAGFLAQAGLAPSDLAGVIGRPEFLAGLMGFVAAEDHRILASAEACRLPPERIARAAAVLNGELPHWT